VIVVAGRSPSEEAAVETLRDINIAEPRILVVSYDDVLAMAEATIKIVERRLHYQPALAR
jgi:hypothetical protein